MSTQTRLHEPRARKARLAAPHRAMILLSLLVALGAGCGASAERVSTGTDGAAHTHHANDPASVHQHVNAHAPPHPHNAAENGHASIDEELQKVASIHGGAGPWVVAGYRMGRYALNKLRLARQSFDVEVIHRSPREVQFSCIADGASAATGASLGKLNLSMEEASREQLQTVYRRRSTGQSIGLRPTAAFAARFLNVPREQLMARGREVMQLRDEEIFEEAP